MQTGVRSVKTEVGRGQRSPGLQLPGNSSSGSAAALAGQAGDSLVATAQLGSLGEESQKAESFQHSECS